MISSSFLLHKKVISCNNSEQKNLIIRKFVFSNLNLYLIVFFMTLPATYYTFFIEDEGFHKGIIHGVAYFLRELVFHSTWRSSWFLMTLIIDIKIVYGFFRYGKMANRIGIIISIVLYVYCVIGSSYSSVLYLSKEIGCFYDLYRRIFTNPYTSLPVGFIYIILGQYIAERENTIIQRVTNRYAIGFVISLFLLLIEGQLVYRYNLCVLTDDCYFSLIPVSLFLVSLCVSCSSVTVLHKKELRESSKITYCLQGPMVQSIGGGLVNCILILISCMAAACFYLRIPLIHMGKKQN